ncbi:MAG: DUF2169 domain-containing protein, partial [Planctomycetes bacterium]|nr:DUF2169 domain-containing protein [Planctomycetota bacterium]
VGIKVGQTMKVIRIFGDRKWSFPTRLAMVPIISGPEPFTKMPLAYERAYGGIDEKNGGWCTENPVGTGFVSKKSKDVLHNLPLPNLEDPNNLITSWNSRPKPVGFGFIGKAWQPRASYAGTYNEKWQNERAPAPPDDFNPLFYNGAHPDLQVPGYLKGDDEVQLVNLTPDGHRQFNLPGVRPIITVTRQDNTSKQLDTPLDTLVFLTDEDRFYMVWRGSYLLQDETTEEIKTVTIEMEKFT